MKKIVKAKGKCLFHFCLLLLRTICELPLQISLCLLILLISACIKSKPIGEYSEQTIAVSIKDAVSELKTAESFLLAFDSYNPETLSGEIALAAAGLSDNTIPPDNTIVVADFDLNGATLRELESPFGSWKNLDSDENNSSQVSIDKIRSMDINGFCARVSYRLSERIGAAAGIWIRFGRKINQSLDLSNSSFLEMKLSGDETEGCSSRLIVELRTRSEMSRIILSEIKPEWRYYRIPLTKFSALSNWKDVTELLIYAESSISSPAAGAYYLDEVRFIK